jgi:hypothetical protein
MNRQESTCTLKDGPPAAIGIDLPPGTEPVREDTNVNQSSPETWALVVTGCLSAALITSLSSRLPTSHTLSWTTIVLYSIKLIALAIVAGTIGISIPWLFLKAKPPFRLAFLSRIMAVPWIFFPCITLLYRQQSPGMFPVLALATVSLAFSLRRLLPDSTEPDTQELPAQYNSDLSSLYGLPIAGFRPVRAFLMATCLQTALILAAVERPLLAGTLLSACLFLLAWRWSLSESRTRLESAGKRRDTLLSSSALLLTILALIPWIAAKPETARNKHRRPALITHESADSDVPGSDYVGIILWPPPVKRTEIVPPRPHSNSTLIGRQAKPVVIPFDGQYWYFKAPSNKPGHRAHIAHGRPTYVNVHSTDSSPLLIEAYQNLGTSIDLECCSEIDVAITNADVRPGAIALGVRLTDSDSIGKPCQDLALQTVNSSRADTISLNRPPVDEILRFPIPRSKTIRRFNEITVMFVPAQERARAGAKISIQSFTLIPK